MEILVTILSTALLAISRSILVMTLRLTIPLLSRITMDPKTITVIIIITAAMTNRKDSLNLPNNRRIPITKPILPLTCLLAPIIAPPLFPQIHVKAKNKLSKAMILRYILHLKTLPRPIPKLKLPPLPPLILKQTLSSKRVLQPKPIHCHY